MEERDWHRVQVLAVAGLIAVAPLALVAAWAIGPIWADFAQAGSDADLVKRYRLLIVEKPTYQSALAAARDTLASGNMFYGGASAELASGQLQEVAQNVVTEAGGQVRSSEIGSPATEQGIQTIDVSLDFSLPQDRLAALLAAINSQKPYLLVQALDVRATDEGDHNAALDVQMTINGFREVP